MPPRWWHSLMPCPALLIALSCTSPCRYGVIGAALGVAFCLIGGVVKSLVGAARTALDAHLGRWPRVVVLATLGGLTYGLLSWAMPLVPTDGQLSIGTVASQGTTIGTGVLAASCFAKILAYFVCIECGFSGGIVLPIVSMSSMLSAAIFNEMGADPVVGSACALVGLAGAIVPFPFFLAVLAVSMTYIGPQGLIPVFATATCAHLLCLGVGIPQGLQAAAQRRKQRRQQQQQQQAS